MLPFLSFLPRGFFLLLLVLAPPCFLRCIAEAQRAPVEYRTRSVSVFGGFLYNNIGFTPASAVGFSAGVNATQHFLRVPLTVALELRANAAYGFAADEHSYVFGPRVSYGFGRYHPYGDFELGLGNIHFGPELRLEEEYYGDKSAVVAGGGGLDVDLFKNVAATVDFQAQHWDIDPRIHRVFIPTLVTFGVHYTIPFRPFHRAGDPYYK